MYTRDNYVCASIPELSYDYSYEEIQSMLNGFVCTKNNEIEHFLKVDAIEFVKKMSGYIICDF